MNVLCGIAANDRADFQPFLESLEEFLERAPPRDIRVLLRNFKAHFGNDSKTRRVVVGRNGSPDLNPSIFSCLSKLF